MMAYLGNDAGCWHNGIKRICFLGYFDLKGREYASQVSFQALRGTDRINEHLSQLHERVVAHCDGNTYLLEIWVSIQNLLNKRNNSIVGQLVEIYNSPTTRLGWGGCAYDWHGIRRTLGTCYWKFLVLIRLLSSIQGCYYPSWIAARILSFLPSALLNLQGRKWHGATAWSMTYLQLQTASMNLGMTRDIRKWYRPYFL